jgi:NAD(P)H-flavin reductase
MAPFPTPSRRTALVDWVQSATPKMYLARFLLPQGERLEFIAGQYGSFIMDQKTRRNFSFTTPSSEQTAFELCADITPMGPGSRWLLALKPGDRIEFLGPLGRFVVDKGSGREKIFVATGTGIAPFRGMILEALKAGVKEKMRLYWGLRYQEDLFWDKEFENLAHEYPQFSYTVMLSRPTPTWPRARGRVTDHIFDEDNFEKKEYYLCGSRAMVDEVRGALFARKVSEEQVKTELFY